MNNILNLIRRIIAAIMAVVIVIGVIFLFTKYFMLREKGRYTVGRTTELFISTHTQEKIRYEYFVDGTRYENQLAYRTSMTVPDGYYLVIYMKEAPAIATLAYKYPLDSAERKKDWSQEKVDPTLVNFWNF